MTDANEHALDPYCLMHHPHATAKPVSVPIHVAEFDHPVAHGTVWRCDVCGRDTLT